MQRSKLFLAILATAAAGAAPFQAGFAADNALANASANPIARRAARAPGADDAQFIRKAAEAGKFEVAAGQLAMSRAQDPNVRQFGQRLMQDHKVNNQKLQRIAGNFGMQLPTRLAQRQQQILQRLREADGQNFDAQFIEQVGVESHERAIALFQHEANAPAGDPALRDYARKALPVLQQHRQIAQNVQAGLSNEDNGVRNARNNANNTNVVGSNPSRSANQSGAVGEVQEAVQVVREMKSDPDVARLLRQARGVLILPDYGRAALGIGVQGGQGVLVTRTGSGFGNPVFYNMGGVSLGAQAGASAGQVAFLLMSDRAVQQFQSTHQNFSLSGDAGITFAAASARGMVSAGKLADVVVWSGTEGAYVGASVALTDIVVDNEANRQYYGDRNATPQAIFSGKVENPHNNVLGMVLAV